LVRERVQLNVTAILTLKQVRDVAGALLPDVPAVVSVFAGRIGDTGRDPVPVMVASNVLLRVISAIEDFCESSPAIWRAKAGQ
jgi:transaldolase